jgi:hypothetical protein
MFRINHATISLKALTVVAVIAGLGTMTSGSAKAAKILMFSGMFCDYCEDIIEDVEWPYQRSDIGHEVPIKFIDLNDIDELDKMLRLKRQGRMDLVYGDVTFVLWDNGHEIDRFTTYRNADQFIDKVQDMAERHGFHSQWYVDDDVTNRFSNRHGNRRNIRYKYPVDTHKYRDDERHLRQKRGTPINIRW